MSMNPADFDYICKLLHQRSAIALEAGKEYLVESRLNPVAKREGLGSLEALVTKLRAEPFNGLHRKVVEAMTTNETSFFRDLHPFEALKQSIIPELIQQRAAERALNIWCGASSSGQEPYSLAMLVREYFPALATWNLRFIASDLSDEMLARARAGRYTQLEVNRGLPATLLVKYFQKQGLEWQIQEELRRMIEFRNINLAEAWPPLPPLDLMMLRNVMIYFDVDTKKAILGKIRRLLKPDGYLFLGGAETTLNLDDSFVRVQRGIAGCYRLGA